MMKVFQGALVATGLAILAAIAGGIGGFMSHAYLAVWFEEVDGLSVTDLKSWPKIADGISAQVNYTRPELYRAYYGENFDSKTEVSVADFKVKYFDVDGRIIGLKTKTPTSGPEVTYNLQGFVSSHDHIVLMQRGQQGGGVGTFWIKRTQTGDNRLIYYGYFLTEDVKTVGSSEIWVTQCPIIIMAKELATKSYPTAEDAKKAFGFLRTSCLEFKLPTAIDRVATAE
jgi:hypothetical protein